MPVFISYSHSDSEFVDKLASQLVLNRTYVWIDRWELAVGDSLIRRIEESIQQASALLVVLSKASVLSEWCRKELSAGLVRELEEKRVLVLPVLLEDCVVPLFLRDKVYADFRLDFDKGLASAIKGVAKFTSDTLGRGQTDEDPQYHHDWGIAWRERGGLVHLEIIAATHSPRVPFTVLTTITLTGNQFATDRFHHFASKGFDWFARKVVIGLANESPAPDSLRILIDDSLPKERKFTVKDSKSAQVYEMAVSCRRLGEDTGMDVLYDVKPILQMCFDQMEGARRNPPAEEVVQLMSLIQS